MAIANYLEDEVYGFVKYYDYNGKLKFMGKVETDEYWKSKAIERPIRTH
jgi:hypothetical protein